MTRTLNPSRTSGHESMRFCHRHVMYAAFHPAPLGMLPEVEAGDEEEDVGEEEVGEEDVEAEEVVEVEEVELEDDDCDPVSLVSLASLTTLSARSRSLPSPLLVADEEAPQLPPPPSLSFLSSAAASTPSSPPLSSSSSSLLVGEGRKLAKGTCVGEGWDGGRVGWGRVE